jgi:hypothetical protein
MSHEAAILLGVVPTQVPNLLPIDVDGYSLAVVRVSVILNQLSDALVLSLFLSLLAYDPQKSVLIEGFPDYLEIITAVTGQEVAPL